MSYMVVWLVKGNFRRKVVVVRTCSEFMESPRKYACSLIPRNAVAAFGNFTVMGSFKDTCKERSIAEEVCSDEGNFSSPLLVLVPPPTIIRNDYMIGCSHRYKHRVLQMLTDIRLIMSNMT